MDTPQQYTFTDIQGISVIVWNHMDSNCDKNVKKNRKILKDKVGYENKDTPMLDSRKWDDSLKYCDIIICTDNVLDWENAINEQYGVRVSSRNIKGGHQLSIIDGETSELFVSVNIYTNTNKLMVQPGDKLEERLLDFLRDIPNITKLKRSRASTLAAQENGVNVHENLTQTSSDDAPNTTTLTSVLAMDPEVHKDVVQTDDIPILTSSSSVTPVGNVADVNIATTHMSSEARTLSAADLSNEDSDVSIEHDANDNTMLSDNDTVLQHYSTPREASTPVRSSEIAVQVSPCRVVGLSEGIQTEGGMHYTNELLCFTQNKLDTMPRDIITRLCVQFYSAKEIAIAKNILFDVVKTKRRHIQRRGDDVAKHDMEDIMQLLLEADLHGVNAVRFVAGNLSNIPPLSIDNVDMLKLYQEIETMKNAVQNISDNQKQLTDLVAKKLNTVQADCQECNTVKKYTEALIEHDVKTTSAPSTSHDACTPIPQDVLVHRPRPDIAETNVEDSDDLLSESHMSSNESVTEIKKRIGDCSNKEAEHHSKALPEVQRTCEAVGTNEQPEMASYNRYQAIANTTISSDSTESNACDSPIRQQHSQKRSYADMQATHDVSKMLTPRDVIAAPGKFRKVTSFKKQPTSVYSRTFTNTARAPARAMAGQTDKQKPYRSSFNNVCIGRGSSTVTDLRSIKKPTLSKPEKNRICIGIFVSRLETRVTEMQISRHILHETRFSSRPEKLKTKYDGYSSFLIQCQNPVRSRLLNPDIWPTGTLVKPFFT